MNLHDVGPRPHVDMSGWRDWWADLQPPEPREWHEVVNWLDFNNATNFTVSNVEFRAPAPRYRGPTRGEIQLFWRGTPYPAWVWSDIVPPGAVRDYEDVTSAIHEFRAHLLMRGYRPDELSDMTFRIHPADMRLILDHLAQESLGSDYSFRNPDGRIRVMGVTVTAA